MQCYIFLNHSYFKHWLCMPSANFITVLSCCVFFTRSRIGSWSHTYIDHIRFFEFLFSLYFTRKERGVCLSKIIFMFFLPPFWFLTLRNPCLQSITMSSLSLYRRIYWLAFCIQIFNVTWNLQSDSRRGIQVCLSCSNYSTTILSFPPRPTKSSPSSAVQFLEVTKLTADMSLIFL